MQTSPAPARQPSRSVSVLGATGSIGDSTLGVIVQHPDRFQVVALTAQRNAKKLIALARTFRPQCVAIGQESEAALVRETLVPLGIEVLSGESGIEEAAMREADITVAAIVGAAGLLPTLRAVEQGRIVALANKEALVCAGALLMRMVRTHGTTLLPIDSEHNAIFQVLTQSHRPFVEKLTLTASGGPLLRHPLNTLAAVTPAEAIRHPKWEMGAKISVDSASMMNKGLELIEAHYLFEMSPAKLDVLIHPQSIVHSLVHYQDGSVLAQLGMPDMAIPIAYTLGWPERLAVETPRLNLAQAGTLSFEPVEAARFPALALARAAMNAGASSMLALNAANEEAVTAFLAQRIGFTAIAETVAQVLDRWAEGAPASIEEILVQDAQARALAQQALEKTRGAA